MQAVTSRRTRHPLEPGDTDWGKDMEKRVRQAEGKKPTVKWHGPERRNGRALGWHLGKEIPLVFVAAIVIQTGSLVWWMAGLSGKVDNLSNSINEFKLERYTREDARRDRELIDQKLQAFGQTDREIDRRMNNTEARIDRIEHK